MNINPTDAKTRFAAIGRLVPKQHRPVAHVTREDGTQTHTKHDADLAYADFFSGSFGSVRVPFCQIVERERRELGDRIVAARYVQKKEEMLQTEPDLCRRFAGVTPFKGIGESKTGSDL